MYILKQYRAKVAFHFINKIHGIVRLAIHLKDHKVILIYHTMYKIYISDGFNIYINK